jgi:NitT/TauT family transport system ATP-binding protein
MTAMVRAAAVSGASGVDLPHVTVRGLRKSFGAATIYNGFDVDIPRGRFVSVFGPNGCGKSTLINLVAGLVPADGGEIRIGGKPVRESRIGYVFQNYREALFPWMTAFENIVYALLLRNVPRPQAEERVHKLVAHLGVKIDLKMFPYMISGGQQQLVSIMRALVIEPEVLFLDEPFSALDFEMTLFIREKLQEVFMQTGTTMMLVSHDLEEAVYLADQVLLLTKRPTKVAEILRYDDARPRTTATLSEPSFIAAKKRSLEIFQREVRR